MLQGFGGRPPGPSVGKLFQLLIPIPLSNDSFFSHPYRGFGSHGVGWRKHPINDEASKTLQSLSLVSILGHWCWDSIANAFLGFFNGLCPISLWAHPLSSF